MFRGSRLRRLLDRQHDRENGASPDLRLDLQPSVVAADDLVDDRQAEAGSGADLLRREERIADLVDDLGRNTAARVRDADRDVVRAHTLRRDDDLALVLDRLRRVRQKVQEYLVDLRRRALDLGNVAVELAHLGLVLDDVPRDRQRLVEPRVHVEARDRRAVETAEVLEALRHIGQVLEAFDAVPREVLGLLEEGLEILLVQHLLHVLQGRDELRLELVAIRELLRPDREGGAAARDELLQDLNPLLDQHRIVREVEERRVDLVADAGDELAERRHLLGLHELDLRFLQALQRVRELLRALGNPLLEGLVELRELGVRAVQRAVARLQAERGETDDEEQRRRVDAEHQAGFLDGRDGAAVSLLRGCTDDRRTLRDRAFGEL